MGNKSIAVLVVLGLSGCLTVCRAETAPFGVASAYNAVALTGNISYSADFTGRIAADGNITGGGTIGDNLRQAALDPFESVADGAMVAGNKIAVGGTNVNAGGSVYGANGVSGVSIANEQGYATNPVIGSAPPTPFPFAGLTATLDSLTVQLASQTVNGSICSVSNFGTINVSAGCPASTAHYNPSWVVLAGSSTTFNVFTISAAQFASGDNLDIQVPTGSTVIINVETTGISNYNLGNSVYVNGQQQNVNLNGALNTTEILFNFPDASGTVTLGNELVGAVIAPYATLDINSQVGGTFLAGSINQDAETHYFAYDGLLQPPQPPTPNNVVTPEPGSLLLLGTGIVSLAGLMRRRKRA